MREITDHKLNGLNDALTIQAMDVPGSGGANHLYDIRWPAGAPDASPDMCGPESFMVRFQNGPIKEAGVNGISGEALLAIVIDRLRGFQSGEYKCRENAIALTQIEDGLMWLQKRTRDRLARGVEGTMAK